MQAQSRSGEGCRSDLAQTCGNLRGDDHPDQNDYEYGGFVTAVVRRADLHSMHWRAVSLAGRFDESRPCNQILGLD
eukprot:scaffold87100_cov26-Prasinocladus_malaysianus.AAC.1